MLRSAVAMVCLLLVGGGEVFPPDALTMIADEPLAPPTLFLGLSYRTPRSLIGEGTFELSAEPETDEVRVHVLVGVPSERRRWYGCRRLAVEVDGERVQHPVRWAGVPMRHGGIYDAVSAELTIEDVRRLAAGADARLRLCGDEVLFDGAARNRIEQFVQRFDELGQYDGPSAPSPPPEPGPELEELDPRLVPKDPTTPA